MARTAEPGLAVSVRRRLPDFFIVGHTKSGTTALYEMLRRHPQIYMPDQKEPWFFATELLSAPRRTSAEHPKTLEDYLSLFVAADPNQRVGEASALYLWSQTAAAGIAEAQPAGRIIAILREPASFLHSLHLQFVQVCIETEKDLRRALSLEDARRRGRAIPRHSYLPQVLLYSEHVRYVEQLERYHARFPPEQVLVLIYDDFQRDNEATVRTVLRFLEVEDTHPVEAVQANPTVRVRSRHLNELVHAVFMGRGPISAVVKRSVKALTPTQLRRAALEATQRRLTYGSPVPPDEALMGELRLRYKQEVVALSEYLDRDLVTLWGYRDVQ